MATKHLSRRCQRGDHENCKGLWSSYPESGGDCECGCGCVKRNFPDD